MSEQKFVKRYSHILSECRQCELALTREEQAAILYVYDYGFQTASPEIIYVLNGVIADLKNQIHS